MPKQTKSPSMPKEEQCTQPASMSGKPVPDKASSTARSSKATKQQRGGLTEQEPHVQQSVKEHGGVPLLSLPSEIRVMIMRYYIGSHTIHIIQPKGRPPWPINPRTGRVFDLDHRRCVVDSEDPKNLPTNEPVTYEDLHNDCNLDSPRGCGFASSASTELDLDLLFVNKQIYQEASEILYGTNTFSFHSYEDLAMFCNPMGETQKRTLRKVQMAAEDFLVNPEIRPEWFRNPCRVHPWPEEVLPALRSLTDLTLIIHIQYLGDIGHLGDRVGHGPVHAVHKVVRRRFGFLRKLKNLQNVVVDIQEPEGLVDPEYLPAINAAFEAELVSPSRLQLIQAEEEEESWRADVATCTRTLSINANERARLSRDLRRYKGHYSKAQRNVQQQSKAIERLEARSKEPSERQKEKLTLEQATLEHADSNVKAVQGLLTAAEAVDRDAVEEKLRLLRDKIAAQEASVFQYIREFEAGRSGRGSSSP